MTTTTKYFWAANEKVSVNVKKTLFHIKRDPLMHHPLFRFFNDSL